MTAIRPVFYVSDGTGITAETVGHSLLTQFTGFSFVTDRLPFVDDGDKAREAAAALGAPRWKVALMITLRAAKSGVITGLLLAIARVSGETAPLLFTALNNQFFSTNMGQPMANLPVVIFQFAMSPYDNWIRLAWGGALLITLTVLAINVVARVFFREKKAGH